MREIPKPYERYRHFKGNEYQVLAIAKSADDLREMVVYEGLYEPYEIYVRDLKEFLSPVDREKYPTASQTERFRKIDAKAEARVETKAEAVPAESAQKPEELKTVPAQEVRQEKPAETPGDRALKQKPGIDPVLLRFLDAETDDDKLEVLTANRDLLTPEILTPMELSLGMEPQEEVDQDIRYKQIRNTLQYKQKYEKSRRG